MKYTVTFTKKYNGNLYVWDKSFYSNNIHETIIKYLENKELPFDKEGITWKIINNE